MSDAARILEVIRDAAIRSGDLVAALRTSGIPGASQAADRLEGGATVTAAVAGLVPPRLARHLMGGIPPLATVAALLADEAWRAAERRRLVTDHLAYPLASVAMICTIGWATRHWLPAGSWYAPIASMIWVLPPAILAALVVGAPWLPRSWHLPGSGWARHWDHAARWARAALVVRWRLTEDQALRLLGVDLEPLMTVLGSPGAEEHCRMLAEWHRRAARRRLVLSAYIAAGLILAAGGGLVLGSLRMWTGPAM